MFYFKDCTTLDEAKTLFRKLSHQLHPDKGGTHEEFIKLRAEFESFKPSKSFESDKDFNRSKFYDMVMKFEGLRDIKISFVGSFIWLEDMTPGATYGQREKIKGIEIEGKNQPRFAGKKKAWYYSPVDYKQKSKTKKSLDQIKDYYGCKAFKSEGYNVLSA